MSSNIGKEYLLHSIHSHSKTWKQQEQEDRENSKRHECYVCYICWNENFIPDKHLHYFCRWPFMNLLFVFSSTQVSLCTHVCTSVFVSVVYINVFYFLLAFPIWVWGCWKVRTQTSEEANTPRSFSHASGKFRHSLPKNRGGFFTCRMKFAHILQYFRSWSEQTQQVRVKS